MAKQNSMTDLYDRMGYTNNVAKPTGDWAPSRQAAPKQSFIGNVGRSLASLPGQAANFVLKATVDPFANLVGNAMKAVNADSNAQKYEQFSKMLDAQSSQAKKDFTAGKLSRAQYIQKTREISQAAQRQSVAAKGDTVKSIAEMAPDAASAAFTVATLGAGGIGANAAKAGAIKAGQAVASKGVASKLAKGAVNYVPDLIGVGKGTLGNGVSSTAAKLALNAPGKLVRNAVLVQPTIQAPGQLATDIKNKNYTGAAVNAALMGSPAIIKGVGKGISTMKLSERAFGSGSDFAKAVGQKRLGEFVKTIKSDPKSLAWIKRQEMFTANQAEGFNFARHLKTIGVDPKTASMDDIHSAFRSYAKQVDALEGAKTPESAIFKAGTEGVIPDNAVISHDFRPAIATVKAKLQSITSDMTDSQRIRAVDEALKDFGNLNPTVANKIKGQLVLASREGADLAKSLDSIVSKNIITTPKGLLDKGFIATYGPKERAVMPSLDEAAQAAGRDGAGIDVGKAPSKLLGGITSKLAKSGVGLEDYNPHQFTVAKENLAKKLSDLGLNGDEAVETLNKAKDELRLGDMRQMKLEEIRRSLGDLSNKEARQVQKAVKDMFGGQSFALRGAAGKLQDANLKYNPMAPAYGRIQAKLRYTDNPFFHIQQRVEALAGAQVSSGFHVPAGDVSKTVKKMREDGFLPGMTKGFDEFLGDTGSKTNITGRLTASEENSLARALVQESKKAGVDVDTMLQDETTRRMLRALVQNPKQGFHSSNFGKAMNLAIFPMNYNLKVIGIAAKAVSKQPIGVQFAIAKSISDFAKWRQSDEGIKWASDNSEVLGILSYFTPINSFQQVFNGISNGRVADLGLVGGLPFGIITRVLQGQGVLPPGNPYLDPKTGQIIPETLPTSTKARIQVALNDMINTIFTYPGRQAGLGSKKQLINTLTGGVLVPGPGESVQKTNSENLTKGQIDTMRVLGAYRGVNPASAPVATPKIKQPDFTIKPKTVAPIYKPSSKKTKAPKAKVYARKPANSKL